MVDGKFWQFLCPSTDVSVESHRLEDTDPPSLAAEWDEVTFQDRVDYGNENKDPDHFRYAGSYPSHMIGGLSLVIAETTFAPDAMIYEIVSERLRDVMALPDHAVQYGEIDDSACHRAAREKNYRRMIVTAPYEIIDMEASGSEWEEIRRPDKPILRLPKSLRKLVWINNPDPPAPLFTDPQIGGHLFCTDEFAERVLRAGITDVAFADPFRTTDDPSVYKRLPTEPFASLSDPPRR